MSNTSSGKALKFRPAWKIEFLEKENTSQLYEIIHVMKHSLLNKKAVKLDAGMRYLNNTYDSIFIVEHILLHGFSEYFCCFST